ncbi:MAG: hypothetical protein ABR906_05190 [Terracidiphilus sp.]|jgi:hypothetical protein
MNDQSALTHRWWKGSHASLIGEILGVGLLWGCFGLVLIWKWWEMPAGSNLITHQIKDAAISLLCVSAGYFIGKLVRIWPKRSKATE